ncbi:hypothetical protein BK120_02770 [Paenibacillus sp. FSL A5-0031]|uniref:hypothetical protein n=1 Tax=Paenibacillus sp. FSL A5-0031 TaxID=1920420 RepID=UPI00096FC352|nr:hypothetical protein [Paenibacillus sp. FSL A5-0031]OME88247.1 hypothetical protein BK120_02770 [Paenibacillus sp. FSL A5-0031]
MKKGIIVILICLVLAACSTEQPSVPQDFLTNIESTDLSKEHTGGISPGDSVQLLTDKRGQPKGKYDIKMKKADDYDVPVQSWEYFNATYTVSESKVASYNLLSDEATHKGAKLGNSIQSVKDMYGDAYYNREHDDLKLLGYIDKEKEWVLEFMVDQEKVTGIMMSELSLFETK